MQPSVTAVASLCQLRFCARVAAIADAVFLKRLWF